MAVWPFGKRKRKQQEPPVVGLDSGSSPLYGSERSHTLKKASEPRHSTTVPHDVTAPRLIPNIDRSSTFLRKANRTSTSVDQSSLLAGMERRGLAPYEEDTIRRSPHLRSATHDGTIHHDFGSGTEDESSHRFRRFSRLQRKSSVNRNGDSMRNPHISTMEDLREESPTLAKNRKSGGISRSGSKRQRGGLSPEPDRPSSQISLPWLGHTDSGISAPSDARNYRISMLNMVAPRPTLQYYNTGAAASWHGSITEVDQLSRNNSVRNRKTTFTRGMLKEDRPVDVLAENLDSAEIREILERDQRRRDRRRERKADELRRRLERREERQKRKEALLDEQRVVAAGAEAGFAGLGIQSYHTTSSMDDFGDESIVETVEFTTQDEAESMDLDQPSALDPEARPTIRDGPWVDPRRYRPASTLYEESSNEEPYVAPSLDPPQEHYVAELEAPEPMIQSKPEMVQVEPERLVSSSIPSETTEQEPKRGGILANLFKRGTTRRRPSTSVRATPPPESSFKNVSRESMARQTPPPHLRDDGNRSRSATPVRTQSRFREDLPELPVSPPDSRVQSPEAGRETPFSVKSSATHSRFAGDRPKPSEPLSLRTQPSTLSGGEARLVSQSLASVDSEGSWFAGRPMSTNPRAGNRIGASSPYIDEALQNYNEPEDSFVGEPNNDGDDEDMDFYSGPSNNPSEYSIVEDTGPYGGPASPALLQEEVDYSSVPADGAPGIPRSRGSLRLRGNSIRRAEEQADVHVVSGVRRQPTVVYRGLRVKSSEGLLNQLTAHEASTGVIESTGNNTPKPPSTHRLSGTRTFFNDQSSYAPSIVSGHRSYIENDTEDIRIRNSEDIDIDNRGITHSELPTPSEAPTPGEASDLEDSTFIDLDGGLKRATSVSIPGKHGHGRNISAGSAKLLDIVRKGSPAPSQGTLGASQASQRLSADMGSGLTRSRTSE